MRNFGIIGGGAVLFTGSAIAGAQTLLPLLGEMIIISDWLFIKNLYSDQQLTLLKALEQQRQWLEEGRQSQWQCAHHHSAGRLSPFLLIILKLSCYSVWWHVHIVYLAPGLMICWFAANVFCKHNCTKIMKIFWQGTLGSVLPPHSIKKRTHLPQILLEI